MPFDDAVRATVAETPFCGTVRPHFNGLTVGVLAKGLDVSLGGLKTV